MSLYNVQKLIFQINRDPAVRRRFDEDINGLLADYALSEEEIRALREPDIGLLYVLGVNGQLLMHYAPLFGIQWFDYLDLMRDGVKKYGPVRAGVYAMTGDGKSFAPEDQP